MKGGPKLTEEQILELRAEMVREGAPVRFLHDSRALDILTGRLCSKGSNVIYHPVYWNFTRETALKIAKWLNVKAVFSK